MSAFRCERDFWDDFAERVGGNSEPRCLRGKDNVEFFLAGSVELSVGAVVMIAGAFHCQLNSCVGRRKLGTNQLALVGRFHLIALWLFSISVDHSHVGI